MGVEHDRPRAMALVALKVNILQPLAHVHELHLLAKPLVECVVDAL